MLDYIVYGENPQATVEIDVKREEVTILQQEVDEFVKISMRIGKQNFITAASFPPITSSTYIALLMISSSTIFSADSAECKRLQNFRE